MRETIKSYKKSLLRMQALVLAVMMAVTAVPSFDLQMVQVAQAVTVPTITFSPLSQENWQNNDKTRATVVTGSSIYIQEEVPQNQGYNPAKLQFRSGQNGNIILDADTLAGGTTVANGNIEVGPVEGVNRRLDFKSEFNPAAPETNGDPTKAATVTYYLNGVYQAPVGQGIATETGSDDKTVTVLGQDGKPTTITATGTNNTLKFKCKTPEDATTAPTFEITGADGYFSAFKTASTTGTIGLWGEKSTSAQNNLTQKTKRTLAFTARAGSNTYFFQVVTDTIHEDHKEPDPKDPTKEIQYYNNYITQDTEFEFIFTVPNSAQPDIALTVVTPQAVMKELEDNVRAAAQEDESDYLRFTKDPANNVDDGPDWVTANILAREKVKRYNANFSIKWKWEPITTGVAGAADAVREGSLNEADNNWRTLLVSNPGKETIEGYLIPEVSFVTGDANPDQKSSTPDLDLPRVKLTIPGQSGEYPKIIQVEEEYGIRSGSGNTTTEKLLGAPPAAPETKKMDAYRGEIDEWNPFKEGPGEGKKPFRYRIHMDMGTDFNAAVHTTVTATGDTDAVILKVNRGNGVFVEHQGGEITPLTEGTGAGRFVELEFDAQRIRKDDPKKNKSVTYTIQFYRKGRGGALTPIKSVEHTLKIDLTDSVPDSESRLKNLIITDQNGKAIENLEYKFNPDTLSYDLSLPYRVEGIQLEPLFMNPQKSAFRDAYIVIRDRMGNLAKNSLTSPNVMDSGRIPVRHDAQSEMIYFTDPDDIGRNSYQISITAPSEDPREGADYRTTYTLNVFRNNASDDSTMASLGIYHYGAEETPENNLIKFDPAKTEYEIVIPYSTDMLKFRPKANYSWAQGPDIRAPHKLEGLNRFDPDKCWLRNMKALYRDPIYLDSGDPANAGALLVQFEVVSELGDVTGNKEGHSTIYTIRIFREEPNHVATLEGLVVADKDKNEQRIIPTFKPETNTYYAEVDYAVEQILLNLDPTYDDVGNIQVYRRTVEPGNLLLDKRDGKNVNDFPDEGPLTFDIKDFSPPIPYFKIPSNPPEQPYILDVTKAPGGYELFIIKVTPECEEDGLEGARDHTKIYNLQVQRKEPSHEARLKSLELKDQGNSPIKTFAFHQDEFNYSLEVPYETTGVSFTPTVLEPHAKFEIVDWGDPQSVNSPYTGLESGATSKVFQLPERHGVDRKYTIRVTAQDGVTQKEYNITIRRAPPSSDAWLKALTTDHTENFKPIFVPKTMDYTAEVKMGEPGVTITATANHPHATIKIDGVVVESGVASDLITFLDVKQTVTIEVTAQDGVTKKYYHIEFTNMNLVELTNNADLKNLTVNYGQMTPKFQAAVTEYEVTVKEDTWSVDIIPRLSDDLAKVRVLNGTRELGDYRGNYALALVDGENIVTVEVTSPDKTVVKNYVITIYRNEEEKLKNLEPLESEDINWENSTNPILVKIEEYPRVGASVFNTIREEYPEKSIIFQGNDYSIRFDGKNLNRVIPQREIFDFRMTFDSPDEDAIYDIIEAREANDNILDDVVLCYFDYHGSLPGPATFNLSLGRKYSNETLYWHYYNQERDRIDYYGSLKSNSKGTVAVSIDHFSTYIVSPTHRIAGSEDKDGIIDQLGFVSNGQDLLGSGGKLNPDTGETEERP